MFESHWHGGILYREEVLPDFIKEGTKMMKKSKRKVLELFESGYPDSLEPGTYSALAEIHRYLFEDIYDFAGLVRDVNIAISREDEAVFISSRKALSGSYFHFGRNYFLSYT